ncbi:hypothetical protein VTK26DRAFT_5969 [Humicola hyalothermophila]
MHVLRTLATGPTEVVSTESRYRTVDKLSHPRGGDERTIFVPGLAAVTWMIEVWKHRGAGSVYRKGCDPGVLD